MMRTAENDWTQLGDYKKKDSIIDRIKKIFEDYKRIFCLIRSMLFD